MFLRELLCAALTLATAAHLWIHREVPPGSTRLALALPVLVAFQLPPLLYDPVKEPLGVIVSMNWPWLFSCSVFGWAIGRGVQAQSFPSFQAFLAFLFSPALPARGRLKPHMFDAPSAALKLLTFALCTVAFDCLTLQPLIYGLLQSFTLYCFTSLCLELATALATAMSGMPAVSSFNKPYLATSLGDFWSKRWNVVAGAKFRATVYEPICHGLVEEDPAGDGRPRSTASVDPSRRNLGMCATFAASGAVHELAFYHLTHRLSGRWMLFFSMQGPLLLVEAWLSRVFRQAGIVWPPAMCIATTTATLHLLAQLLFFPDIVAEGIPQRMLRQVIPGGICSAAAAAPSSNGFTPLVQPN